MSNEALNKVKGQTEPRADEMRSSTEITSEAIESIAKFNAQIAQQLAALASARGVAGGPEHKTYFASLTNSPTFATGEQNLKHQFHATVVNNRLPRDSQTFSFIGSDVVGLNGASSMRNKVTEAYLREFCNRLVEIYQRQASKAHRLIDEAIQSRNQFHDDTETTAEEQLSFAFELLGEPGLFAAATYISPKGNEVDNFKVTAFAIARVNDPETQGLRVGLLAQCLSSQSIQMRFVAVQAIGEIGGPAAKEMLNDVLAKDQDTNVRRVAHTYLKSFR